MGCKSAHIVGRDPCIILRARNLLCGDVRLRRYFPQLGFRCERRFVKYAIIYGLEDNFPIHRRRWPCGTIGGQSSQSGGLPDAVPSYRAKFKTDRRLSRLNKVQATQIRITHPAVEIVNSQTVGAVRVARRKTIKFNL